VYATFGHENLEECRKSYFRLSPDDPPVAVHSTKSSFQLLMAVLASLLLVVSAPEGIKLPSMASVGQETTATIIRVPGGNFRLLARLLTQIERILKINDFNHVTKFGVETARETLVIGCT
jgi:hypothetical protein